MSDNPPKKFGSIRSRSKKDDSTTHVNPHFGQTNDFLSFFELHFKNLMRRLEKDELLTILKSDSASVEFINVRYDEIIRDFIKENLNKNVIKTLFEEMNRNSDKKVISTQTDDENYELKPIFDEKKKDSDENKPKLEETIPKFNEYKTNYDDLLHNKDRLEIEKERLSNELSRTQNELSELKTKNQTLINENIEHSLKNTSVMSEVSGLVQKTSDCSKKISEYLDQNSELSKKNIELSLQVSDQLKLISNLQGKKEALTQKIKNFFKLIKEISNKKVVELKIALKNLKNLSKKEFSDCWLASIRKEIFQFLNQFLLSARNGFKMHLKNVTGDYDRKMHIFTQKIKDLNDCLGVMSQELEKKDLAVALYEKKVKHDSSRGWLEEGCEKEELNQTVLKGRRNMGLLIEVENIER